MFDAFYAQLLEELSVNDLVDLSRYLGLAFESNQAKGDVKMAQTVFVYSLIESFDIQYESQSPRL